ncbi:MAG: 16S rRNA (guanine(966)-N(2))-methyltransferase RsmD [Chloroflexi bacterium]|nr:16S rRNA (guanine(966)-N(2))-methyltransferase RsmD [Chloroflexota bacterium]
MRVIGGTAKGYPLKVPKGISIRPTSDLIRGALFSMLESMLNEWDRILDLYAGTGALGIEALSRGAQWADFVEENRRCCAVINHNLERTQLISQAHVYCAKVERAITFLSQEYKVILLDPPYDANPSAILEKLVRSPLAGKETIIATEHFSQRALEPNYNGWQRIKERRHGDSCITIYRAED